MRGIITATIGITKNRMRFKSEVSQNEVYRCQKVEPDSQRLLSETVAADYIVLTQRPGYASEAAWKNLEERPAYIRTNKLRFLREYQLKAVHEIQKSVREGKDRFLFEMATGTGKTLTATAVIKLFLRSGNARRVLFLVDRLELEDQAKKAFAALLSADFQTVIYKENRDDWRRARLQELVGQMHRDQHPAHIEEDQCARGTDQKAEAGHGIPMWEIS